MKTSIRILALAALVTLASLPQTLHAQTKALTAQINVPFAFDYGVKHLSPGMYRIDMQHQNLLILRGPAGPVMAMTRPEVNGGRLDTGRAVFTKYGDRFVLDELWIAGNATHLDIYNPKAKQRTARLYSFESKAPAQIELALLSPTNTAAGN
ncbi:hypothetical protein HNQ77_000602 [Silvibacterium bohemicum]|uniref:Uncharacterized protein n=1 Tax=Silvibacterium bohemicum TaxID=1577686 RepID=A0A841JXE2_9BACT|nr:hypothetical protein [Silvibacterium bohemicum]MBB6142664.1 hypothetical protein [Silvibacterium bohemicum]